ncbi:hypothetical protein K488DRAFT_72544 [Vararia minispora EC-137]|uniref:Uncharacterized protein n=1 Tax=Vararia minispora EC-137 TaxID=1314806 RepID=A0ACB8QDV6_9AGAM|nr:hypothetical protein K488DRAFT_72544 [Vararia minispora EC-137]
MDHYSLDAYAVYSSSPSGSTPRTPSPNSSLTDSIGSLPHTPAHYKLDIEPVPLKPILISDHMDDNQHGIAPEGVALWQTNPNAQPPVIHAAQFSTPPTTLLGELYEHDLHPQDQHLHEVSLASHEWHQQHHPQHHHLQQQQDVAALRRATYPYVRQEREDAYSLPPFIPQDDHRPQHVYTESLSMLDQSAQPGPSLVGPDLRHHSFTAPGPFEFSSPAHIYRDLDPHVKLEDPAMSGMVPSQVLYRSPSMDHMHQPPFLQHPPIPVQHTDDAASKETQYLRRRCFNCSQTEPPSWRRSTLNPGKIVCNKCGLYERTHLRPRPLRFDELRTGNKSRRKKAATLPTAGSAAPATSIKLETAEAPVITRRSSVSSASSTSDWDDSLSVASSGSASVSTFNSPVPPPFSLPLEASGQSPQLLPRDGGIRLPNVDIVSLSMGSPRPTTAPEFGGPQGEYFVPMVPSTSLPGTPALGGSPAMTGSPAVLARDMPEVTGWQSISIDGSAADKSRRSSILRKTVVA